jgi:hypothetical protein
MTGRVVCRVETIKGSIERARASRWFAWKAVVLGVLLFVPFADFFAPLVGGLWILVTSIPLACHPTVC